MATDSTTFAVYGHALGLSDDAILDALCEALADAGPAVGGRFVSPYHFVEDDRTSRIAVDSLLRRARSTTHVSRSERAG